MLEHQVSVRNEERSDRVLMSYVGDELGLFREARTWKAYYAAFLRRWIRGDVIEVGAGIGGTTPFLINDAVDSWICVEPDPAFREELLDVRELFSGRVSIEVQTGDLRSIEGSAAGCIVYIDVLEHIENDSDELEYAASCLKPGGRLIVLAPALPSLFSAFDRAIGHYRRYNRHSIRASIPVNCKLTGIWFLDSLGMLLSLGNRLLMKQSTPTPAQIRFWDQRLLPVSKLLDTVLRHSIGKTVIWILEKNAEDNTKQFDKDSGS